MNEGWVEWVILMKSSEGHKSLYCGPIACYQTDKPWNLSEHEGDEDGCEDHTKQPSNGLKKAM